MLAGEQAQRLVTRPNTVRAHAESGIGTATRPK
jgi:hypothetical protein